jgi:hypothetical protein
VGASLVEKREVASEAGPDVGDGLVGVQVDLFVFHGAPEPLDEYVVPPAALAVPADLNLVGPQHAQEVGAGELRALIGVEDLGPAEALERLFECGHAEIAGERGRDPPGEDFPREPVHDGGEEDETPGHRDVDDVGGPDLIRDPTVSVDLLLRSLFKLGAKRKDIARAIA